MLKVGWGRDIRSEGAPGVNRTHDRLGYNDHATALATEPYRGIFIVTDLYRALEFY